MTIPNTMSRILAGPGPFLRTLSSQKPGVRIALKAILALGFCLLTWAGALIRVPIPGTPVPLTFQTVPVLLSGALLGPGASVGGQALYLLLGLSGAPAFSGGGAGWVHLAGPTGGYLYGFLPGAFLVGWLVGRRRDPGFPYLAFSVLAGSGAIFLSGVVHLSLFLGGDLTAATLQGALIFLPWDLLKVVAVAGAARLLRPVPSPSS